MSLSQEDLNRTRQLSSKILSEILQSEQGCIPFSTFMDYALYEPCLGYYRSGKAVIGKGSIGKGVIDKEPDYITAPEISSLFSISLAIQCAEIFSNCSAKKEMVEVGAGNGTMAADILLHLEKIHSLPDAYHIIEPDIFHQERQQKLMTQKCHHLFKKVKWHMDWPTESFCGVVISNELFDALPVESYVLRNGKCFERYVGLEDEQFVFFEKEISFLNDLPQEISSCIPQSMSTPYFFEMRSTSLPMIKDMADHLSQGVILIVDYGYPSKEYYHPDRIDGHLLSYRKQNIIFEFLKTPGLQDISCHVDFTSLAWAADHLHLNILGFCSQAAFLLSTDLLENYQSLSSTQTEKENFYLQQAIQLLTSPAEMGEIVKVMAIGKNYSHSLKGFDLRNDCRRL